ncbi:hypothetical protein [Halalkalibacter urbisdiaboli]|uniref:hypothetical protein n=1 Tax=Halalkalibacter urbisdiaboli TaxID=1960589 RepID=UPI000B433A88|nr:hypothetical protein [Halalkalibacter urbisdiaboli]
MKKVISIIMVFVFIFSSFIAVSGTASASTPFNVVDESKQIYITYFQEGKHVEATKLGDKHNGPGSKGSENAGFFRAATDAIFLISLYSRLKETSDPLRTNVRTDAIATLDHLRDRMKLSGPYNHTNGWRLNATATPDTGMTLKAFSKAIVELDLTTTQRTNYLNFADELALALKNARDRHKNDNSSTWPNAVLVDDCNTIGLKRTAIKHNILSISAGGLGAYAHPNVRGRYNQYREVMTDFAIYSRSGQLSNGLWLNGGGYHPDNNPNNCKMEVGYDVWDIVGLTLAAKGSLGTTGTTLPTGSSFFTSATNGVSGLNSYYVKSGNVMYRLGNGTLGGKIASSGVVSAHALPISYVGTTEAKNLFFTLYPQGKNDMIQEANNNEINDPNGNAPNFHRLIHGLAGALDNRF